MRIIFCDSVIDRKMVEPDYQAELLAAQDQGFTTSLLSFEDLMEGNFSSALKFVRPSEGLELAYYRGWMLKPEIYTILYAELLQRNIKLVNNPEEYTNCHWFPNSYSWIAPVSPLSNWTQGNEWKDFEQIFALTSEFGTAPVIVKDYVKSEKHNWEEACFIPDASDQQTVKRVVERFLELRGRDFNEGLVFRKFEQLKFLQNHSKSGMPLTEEFRLFIANGKLIEIFRYWDEGDYASELPDMHDFLQIVRKVKSNFFTMDIARKSDGSWIIVELGDGQTAGLPDNADPEEFYQKLKANF
ncbi:MAG: ATP-grasp domain-containing protein [Bacteroidia bacterium]|nr:ATP-grasp domain-containing protein [Bacteroidia bacterium]